MTDLTTQTPPEIDTRLADLFDARLKAQQMLGYWTDELHRYVGDKRVGGRFSAGPWSMGLDALLGAMAATTGYTRTLVEQAQEGSDKARCDASRAQDQIDTLDEEFARRGGWSRFFLVKNNNGHVHSSMHCSTCFATTHFGWLPALSGLTEKDAVEQEGEILCSVCFPSAPSEWTDGESRATKEIKARRATEKATSAAKKLEKALLPDGSPLCIEVGRQYPEQITTLHAAKAWLTDEAEWNRGGTHPSFPPLAKQQVAEAVAAKTGETVEEVLAAAKKRAEKRK